MRARPFLGLGCGKLEPIGPFVLCVYSATGASGERRVEN